MSGDVVERLRSVVSACAAAIGNGAFVAPTCSVEFMEKVPREIQLAMAGKAAEIAQLDRVIDGLNRQLTEQFELSTKYVSRAETAERLLAEARAALEPFAKYATARDAVDPDYPDYFRVTSYAPTLREPGVGVTLGDFRTAARTLTNGGQNGR